MAANIGFLTVRRHRDHGYFGGYLVVNELARPMEFHCTLPLKPSRAQTVLFGPTLEDFICGEQIGRALVEKAKLKPPLIISDSVATLALSMVCEATVVSLVTIADSSEPSKLLELPSQSNLATECWSLGEWEFGAPKQSSNAREISEQLLGQLGPHFDLTEPFSRIVEALNEAHPTTRAA
jgi:hypothetical protein